MSNEAIVKSLRWWNLINSNKAEEVLDKTKDSSSSSINVVDKHVEEVASSTITLAVNSKEAKFLVKLNKIYNSLLWCNQMLSPHLVKFSRSQSNNQYN